MKENNPKDYFINAKVSFIKNIMEKGILGYENIEHFVRLDSDILVVGDISSMYKLCLDHPNAAVASTNLYFLRGDLPQASPNSKNHWEYNYGGHGSLTSISPEFSRSTTRTSYHDAMEQKASVWRTSGGVLFFNVNKFRQNVHARDKQQEKLLVDTSLLFEDEEVWIDNLMAKIPNSILILPPIYNFRPTMKDQAQLVLSQNPKIDTAEQEILRQVASEQEIVIYHWDTIKKPWEKKKRSLRLPTSNGYLQKMLYK